MTTVFSTVLRIPPPVVDLRTGAYGRHDREATPWGWTRSRARPRGPAAHGHRGAAYRNRLRIALGITLSVMVIEIIGGVVADSLALIADAAHMATDAVGLAMALLAIHFANRPPSGNRTFGYARAEILAALANCLLLLGVGGYVLFEAVQRFLEPAGTRAASPSRSRRSAWWRT